MHATQGTDTITGKSILGQLIAAGVSASTASEMMKQYPLERIANQVRMLNFRNAREPAAMLVKAIREDWAAPSGVYGHEAPGKGKEGKDGS